MSEKEFNLSDKIVKESLTKDLIYLEKDVKEFIRLLKEEIYLKQVEGLNFEIAEKVIDALAGDKLK